MSQEQDYTPGGLRIEGSYENDRNAAWSALYKAILREVYGVTDVIVAHHLVFVRTERRQDGFEYQIVEEIPSADTLIFDHEIAQKLWPTTWPSKLAALAKEPVETRDQVLEYFYRNRGEAHAETQSSDDAGHDKAGA